MATRITRQDNAVCDRCSNSARYRNGRVDGLCITVCGPGHWDRPRTICLCWEHARELHAALGEAPARLAPQVHLDDLEVS